MSEASSKREESSSEDGSGSSCQSLSEDDQDKMLSQVLGLFRPDLDQGEHVHSLAREQLKMEQYE